MKSPNWLEEELILAVNFYLEHGRKWVNSCSSKSPDIIAFSNLLRSLTLFSEEQKGATNFRSPSSVHMKLMNFKGIDQDNTAEGLRNSSVLDKQVWSAYANDPQLLLAKATTIISEFSPSVAFSVRYPYSLQDNHYIVTLSEAKRTLETLLEQFRLVREKAVSINSIDVSQKIINLMYEYISQLAVWHRTIDDLIKSASDEVTAAQNKTIPQNKPQYTKIQSDKRFIRFSQKYSSVSLNADLLKSILLKIKEIDARDISIKTSVLIDEMADQILGKSAYQHPSHPLRAVIKFLKDVGVIIPYQNAKIGKYVIEDYEIMQRLIDNPFQIQELIQNKE